MFNVDKVLKETAGIYHVYAMLAGPIIKIGVSNNLLQRFNMIYNEYVCRSYSAVLYDVNAYEYPLQLIGYVKGDGQVEGLIHSLIFDKKVPEDKLWGREWFYADSQLLSYVDCMNNCRINGISGIEVFNKIRDLRSEQIGEYAI